MRAILALTTIVAVANCQSCGWGTVWDGTACSNFACNWAFNATFYDLREALANIVELTDVFLQYTICLEGDFTWTGPAIYLIADTVTMKPIPGRGPVTITRVGSDDGSFGVLKSMALDRLTFLGRWSFSAATNAEEDSLSITNCVFDGPIKFTSGYGLSVTGSRYTSTAAQDLTVFTLSRRGDATVSNCIFENVVARALFGAAGSHDLTLSQCTFTNVHASVSALYGWDTASVTKITVSLYSGGSFMSARWFTLTDQSSFSHVQLASSSDSIIACTSCDLHVRTSVFTNVSGGYLLTTASNYRLTSVVVAHVSGGIAPSVSTAILLQVVIVNCTSHSSSLISAEDDVELEYVIITQSAASGSLLQSGRIQVEKSLIFDNFVSPLSVTPYGSFVMETSVFCENPNSVTEVSDDPTFGTGDCATECLSMPVGPDSCWQPLFESAPALEIGDLPPHCSCPVGGLCPLSDSFCTDCSVDTTTGLPFCVQCENGRFWSTTASACVEGVTTLETPTSDDEDEEDGLLVNDESGAGGGTVVGAVVGGIVGFLIVACACSALLYIFVLAPSRRTGSPPTGKDVADEESRSDASGQGRSAASGSKSATSDDDESEAKYVTHATRHRNGRLSMDKSSDDDDVEPQPSQSSADADDRKYNYIPANAFQPTINNTLKSTQKETKGGGSLPSDEESSGYDRSNYLV